MATLNSKEGTIVARCLGCDGAKSSFTWRSRNGEFGSIEQSSKDQYNQSCLVSYRLFRCGGCGIGGIGVVRYYGDPPYPGRRNKLIRFFPESKQHFPLPSSTPKGITAEFREAERCLDNNCYRAASGLFRSVLDKTMRANGYKKSRFYSLEKQIDDAAGDGIITEARKKRAHEDIRVLGNDVLHDEWREIKEEDVELAHHYSQRILEDLYDDRESVLTELRAASRVPEEDRKEEDSEGEEKES